MASYSLAASGGDTETLDTGLIEAGDRDGGIGETTILPDEPKMPIKPKDCCAYVRENPCERWQFVMYWVVALYGLVMMIVIPVNISSGSSVVVPAVGLGVITVGLFGWAAYNFRIALKLREQVNLFARQNAQFKSENRQIAAEVDSLGKANGELRGTHASLKESNKKMEENVKKFTQLQHNLAQFAGGNIAGMEEFQKKCDSMGETWKQSLIKNEKSMFLKIFDEMEMKDDQPDMTQEEYGKLLDYLTPDYRKIFEEHHKTWEEIAGDDNIMQFEEFQAVVDEIVEARVYQKMEE